MIGPGEGHSRRKSKHARHIRRSSTDSNTHINPIFFGTDQPAFNASQTWKSDKTKERDQYERKRNLVKHIAPEQFRNPAKPTNGPCNLFPMNLDEWLDYKQDVNRIDREEMNRYIKTKEERKKADRKIREERERTGRDPHIDIKLAFGPSRKPLKQGSTLSTVLARPTAFTPYYAATPGRPQSQWPSHAELHEDGDHRENQNAQTRCGRFLPVPRYPADPSVPFREREKIEQLELDQLAHTYYRSGLGPSCAEYTKANETMDRCEAFRKANELILGAELMQELGEWKKPFIPDWVLERKAQQTHQPMQVMHAHPIYYFMQPAW